MTTAAEPPLSKVYRIRQLALVGEAACEADNDGLPLSLAVVFETIALLAAELFDDMAPGGVRTELQVVPTAMA